MSDKSKIQDALRKLVAPNGEQYCIVATVDSVDLTTKTCEVTVINGDADLQGVRLLANATTGGMLLIPAVGSIVVCSFLNDAVAYVSMYSEVSEIRLNGTSYGGLVKVADLLTKLNALEAFANTVVAAKNLIAAAAVSSPGTPVTNATLAAFMVGITPTPLVLSTLALLQNTTVKHGNGT